MTSNQDSAGRPIVVVTGIGVVTSLGAGKDENWKNLTAGQSGIKNITRFATDGLKKLWGKIAARLKPGQAAVLSGASGTAPATAEERAFFAEHKDIAVRATGTYIGHAFEPQFPMNVALAAVAVSRGKLYPPADESGLERPMNGPLTQVVVTSIGHWRGEGLALVEAA